MRVCMNVNIRDWAMIGWRHGSGVNGKGLSRPVSRDSGVLDRSVREEQKGLPHTMGCTIGERTLFADSMQPCCQGVVVPPAGSCVNSNLPDHPAPSHRRNLII